MATIYKNKRTNYYIVGMIYIKQGNELVKHANELVSRGNELLINGHDVSACHVQKSE